MSITTTTMEAIPRNGVGGGGGGVSDAPGVSTSGDNSSDYIFKVVFDTYGRRMATCSADRLVRLWDLQDSGDWMLVGQWQAHRGAVTSLAFAHPEFGHLLATCGSDHDVMIWEEKTATTTTTSYSSSSASSLAMSSAGVKLSSSPAAAVAASNAATGSTPATQFNNTNNNTTTAPMVGSTSSSTHPWPSRWVRRASLTDARRAATCLEFAPRHWGLQLAVGSADGCVRIYEAVDIMNLAQWPLAATLQLPQLSSSSSQIVSSSETSTTTTTTNAPPPHVSSLSWCTGRFEPPTLVVGGSHLMIYRYIEGAARSWQVLLELETTSVATGPIPPPGRHRDVVNVAWAPNVGRRYHFIAATFDDGQLNVYKVLRGDVLQPSSTMTTIAVPSKSGAALPSSATAATTTKEAAPPPLWLESCQTLPTEHAAWTCQWNVTGTVLACSGDDGVVQLWKADPTAAPGSGLLVCVSQVQSNPRDDDDDNNNNKMEQDTAATTSPSLDQPTTTGRQAMET